MATTQLPLLTKLLTKLGCMRTSTTYWLLATKQDVWFISTPCLSGWFPSHRVHREDFSRSSILNQGSHLILGAV